MRRSALVLPTLLGSVLCGAPLRSQEASDLEIARDVEALLIDAFDAATTEWIACGFGALRGKRVVLERVEWASVTSDGGAATGTCRAAPDLVVIAHPHLPRRVAGREPLCLASESDRRAHRSAGVAVTLIVCEKGRYVFLTHPRGRERAGRFLRPRLTPPAPPRWAPGPTTPPSAASS